MGGPHTKIRRHSRVDKELPDEIRAQVDRLLIESATYEEIVEFLKTKGHDISKSSIGRYGKEFLANYQRLRIIEDQSRTLVSDAGDGMILEEAASKIFSQQIIELLMKKDFEIGKLPRIISDFAKLQASSQLRERLKNDFDKKKGEFFIDCMKELISFLSKNDPEAVPVLEKNFDDFIAHAKEKYGIK